MNNILTIEDLCVAFNIEGAYRLATDSVSFTLQHGEALAIVGESGCGKSAMAMAILRLLPAPLGKIVRGRVLYEQGDLVTAPLERMYQVRGGEIGFVFQEPMTALNPVLALDKQLIEAIELHQGLLGPAANAAALALLEEVGISEAHLRLKAYPHELSGGLRQRAGIALALAGNPKVLIADEPTSALDVSHKAQIISLLKGLKIKRNLSLIFITHELGLIRQLCQRALVMYAGQVIELTDVNDLFDNPKHPYTKALLSARPTLKGPRVNYLKSIPGLVPIIGQWPMGCRFYDRCPYAAPVCLEKLTWNGSSTHGALCVLPPKKIQ